MRAISVVVILFSISCPALSQSADSTRNTRPVYFNQLLSGTLLGDGMPVSFTGTMVHGVRISRFGLGAGLSYDLYGSEWRTIPLFAIASCDLASNGNQSLSLQLGAGHAWLKRISKIQDGFNYSEQGGRFLQPALSYRLATAKLSIYILAGYRLQRMKYVQTPRWWWGGDEPSRNNITRDSSRGVIQIGFGLR